MIYFWSDTHFGHDKDFIWKERGYENVEEMNEDLVKKWNDIVKDDDIVYFLGDVIMGDITNMRYLDRLNGHINIILGNHCTEKRQEYYNQYSPNVDSVKYADLIKYGKYHFYLSHYPTLCGNHEEKHAPWCLCGHTHTKDKYLDMDKRCYHVEVDAHPEGPVSIETIIQDIKSFKELNKKEN